MQIPHNPTLTLQVAYSDDVTKWVTLGLQEMRTDEIRVHIVTKNGATLAITGSVTNVNHHQNVSRQGGYGPPEVQGPHTLELVIQTREAQAIEPHMLVPAAAWEPIRYAAEMALLDSEEGGSVIHETKVLDLRRALVAAPQVVLPTGVEPASPA